MKKNVETTYLCLVSLHKRKYEVSTFNNGKAALAGERLLNWLKQRSLAQIFDWFDCLEETTVKTGAGVRRWTTESVARDRLFMELLGVVKS